MSHESRTKFAAVIRARASSKRREGLSFRAKSRNGAKGESDIDGCAARVAARESGDERVNLWLFRFSLHEIRDLSTSLEMTGSQNPGMENFICVQCGTQFSETAKPPLHCPICED